MREVQSVHITTGGIVPKKILPKPLDFEAFEKNIRQYGFRQTSSDEIQSDIRRFGLKPPRKRTGREVGFVYLENGLSVYVWTTWLRIENEARTEDAGWVLIVAGQKILYASHPIHRTKNFLENLLTQARIARIRVKRRPRCWKCGEFMIIISAKVLKARYWYCGQRERHDDHQSAFCNWDDPLPLGMKLYVKIMRQRRAKYRKKLADEGHVVTPTILSRKSW